MTISRLEPNEFGQVTELLAQAYLPLDGLSPDAFILVARDNGRIVGTAALEEYSGGVLVRSVAVERGRRGTGLGSALMRAVLDAAIERGHRSAYLLTTTAGAFFPRFGFVPVARDDVPADVRQSVEFTSACPSSALVMCATMRGRSGRPDRPS